MEETTTTALNALEAIKRIVLTHMEQDVDYDYEENPEYSYHEECDGTVGDNYPCEVAFIEKALKALEIIKKKNVIMEDLERSDELKDYNIWGYRGNFDYYLSQEEFDLLKEVLG